MVIGIKIGKMRSKRLANLVYGNPTISEYPRSRDVHCPHSLVRSNLLNKSQ
jgi:hypothetical protein